MTADVRYALRGLVNAPAVLVLSVLTLGVGIGVVSASFAVVDAVVFRPITHDQDRVVRVWNRDRVREDFRDPYSFPEFRHVRDTTRTLSAVAAIQYADYHLGLLTVDDAAIAVNLTPVSAEFLPLMVEAPPVAGRWMTAGDEERGADLTAVVSERFWRRAAAADPSFVGRRLRLEGRTLVVVGVAPAAFDYPVGTDLWVPIAAYFDGAPGHFDASSPAFAHFELVGRLAPGVGAAAARSELETLSRQFATMSPDDVPARGVVVQPLLDAMLSGSPRIWRFLLGAAALVLAIAGVNVGALLLMRAAARRRESAVRLALGATRARLAGMALVESGVIAFGAAVVGVTVAWGLLAVFRWLGPGGVPRIAEAVVDVRVLAWAVVAALGWVLTLGLAPAWSDRRLGPAEAGDLSSRSGARVGGLRVFTVVQIAAAVVVTIAGALLLRSFLRLEAIDRGFDPVNLSLVAVVTPEDRFPDRRARLALFDRLTRRLAGLPGVMSATSIHMGPGTGSGGLSARMLFEGQTPDEAKTNPYATFDSVMPSYFDTMGIPIVEGRPFSEADREGARRVVIVSQSVADRYWPGERAIGKTVRFEADAEPAEVVGVAREMRYRELTRTWLTVYFPAHEFFWFKPAALAVRTASAPAALVPSIRAALRVEEPTVAIAEVLGMPEALAAETSRQRTALAIIAFFAITATLLSAIGVYSVLGYEVGYRRRELAVRSALGADPARLFRAVVGRSAVLGIAGLAIGAAVALPATRALDSLLFEVDRADPVSFAASAGLMLIVTLVGASLPAIRAARTDPVSCLRSE